ncbi:ferric reductase-like transmembrane domain-containing protein [Actinokineospora sp. 24-640]
MNPGPAAHTAAPLISESTYWYLSRASGFVSLAAFTAVMALGLLTAGRVASPRWPRFVTEALHRNVSLFAIALVALHAVVITADEYVKIGLVDVVVPFTADYRPLWLGLGTIAFDTMVAVLVTSLLRARLGFRVWRAVHWLAYAGWPIALAHTVGLGTDRLWVLVVVGASVLTVLVCGGYRLAGWRRIAVRRPV